MGKFLSYIEQGARYFDRPHTGAATAPLGGPAAWTGPELAAAPGAWRTALSAADIDEIERALDGAEKTRRATEELTASDFPLPTLVSRIGAWREALAAGGLGLQVVSGVPVDRWPRERSERFFWCLGHHLGRPGAQNPAGDLLGHVRDTGADTSDPFTRLYQTASDIRYHCDVADVVGLLCLQTARKGGASRIVSSVTVFDALAKVRPDLVDRLWEPFALDARNEDKTGAVRWIPAPPCRFANGHLRTCFHSDYFRSAERHDDVTLSPLDRELLDTYESIANDPALYLDMELAPGDIQLLSNHTVLHARTAYEDPPNPAHRRHLLRLWLSLD